MTVVLASALPARHPDTSLLELVNRILPVCSSYYSIQTYIQIHARWEYGLVAHAFASAMRTILKEYLVLIAQLEYQFACRKLTLVRVWYYIQPCLHTLTRLDHLCSRVTRTTGGTMLNLIHSQVVLAGDPSTREVYTHLLTHASIPYFSMLTKWLTQGVIDDVYDEFQIKQSESMSKDNVQKDFNDTYWEERYTVRTEKVPTFLAACK
jgi:gamma-tubulin complex component 2